MTQKMTCDQIANAIRDGLPEGYAKAARFQVRKVHSGFLVIVPTHQVGGKRVLKTHFDNSDSQTLVAHIIAHFKSSVPEDTVASLPREFLCAKVSTAIRQALKGLDGIRFNVRPVRDGLCVIIPFHRTKGVEIPRAH